MAKKQYIIYKATNKITGESYIGQTYNSLHNRIVDHVYEAFKRNLKDKFHSALREFGCRNFEWTVLHITNSIPKLRAKERDFIRQYQTIDYGYNTQIRKD